MISMRFQGKKVILTGASSGIGRATAQLFASQGAKVYALDINKDGLAETAEGHENITTAICDVAKRKDCQKAVETAVKELGGLDVLANIAGIFRVHNIKDIDEDVWNQIMNINTAGTFWMAQASIPHLLKSKGNIVNVASTAGIMGQAYTAPYCASKGAVILLTKSLAMEFAKSDLRVNAVAPGGVDTPIAQNFEMPDGADLELIGRYSGFRGLSEAKDIAETIAFLASDEALRINGTIVTVDAGMTAG